MKIKRGASIQGLKIEMRPVLVHAAKIWYDIGRKELVITSGTEDYAHSPGSLHPYGYALDLRTHYFNKNIIGGITAELRARLGDKYLVKVAKNHIHVEYRYALTIHVQESQH